MEDASLLFGGEPFAKVLDALMERPGELLTPVQIERRTELTSRDSLYRALTRGRQLGLIERQSTGVSGAYRINTKSRLYPDVKLLVDKLTGFYRQLGDALLELSGCEVAFVQTMPDGRGDANSESVALFIMGSVTTSEAMAATAPVARRFGRGVKVTALSRRAIEKRIGAGDNLIRQIWEHPKIFLFGSEFLLPDARGASRLPN